MQRRTWMSGVLCAGLLIGVAGRARAADPPAVASPTPAEAKADAKAKRGEADLRARFVSIQTRGAKVSAKSRADADAKLAAILKAVDDREAIDGSAALVTRIAAEFGMTPEVVIADKHASGASFGELMLAYTLDANTEEDVTALEMIELHQSGTGWGQIAAGLGFKLGEVVTVAKTETRVASGLLEPDGKVAQLTGGARVGIGPAVGAESNNSVGEGIGVGTDPTLPVPTNQSGKP